MLRFILTDVNGLETELPYPVSLTVDADEAVPADSLYAVFPYVETAEAAVISVFDDDRLLIKGIVDEEEHTMLSGEYDLRISARSMAALLLDNEAMPCVYDHPSASLMKERYAEPFGIEVGDNDDAVYFGEQTVAKGSSCWSVLKNFCNACYSCAPRVSSDGVLWLKGLKREEAVRFGEKGVRYTDIRELHKRCEELSAVKIKTENPGGYDRTISDISAVGRGIARVRYLNALLTGSPMRCADAMLKNSAAKAYSVRLRCPSCLLGYDGCAAVIDDAPFDIAKGLYISSLRYRLTKNGGYTDVTLKRRNN